MHENMISSRNSGSSNIFANMKNRIFLCLIVLAFVSCKKDPLRVSGTNSLVYESEAYTDVMTNFEALINRSVLHVENADPYRHIIGNVIENAAKTQIDGNGVAISNIEISNVRVTSLELYSGFDIALLDEHLGAADVSLSYLDASSTLVSISLGTLSSINNGQSKVLFSPTGVDLTSFMKNNPDRLSFNLYFNDVPSSSIDVKYRVGFDYSYAYDEAEVK
jgi:hypothetical protein